MNPEDYCAEIKASLKRSQQAIQAAEELLQKGYGDFAASRAYYAATALLLNEGLEFAKHSGIIAAIHKRFIKTARLEKQCGKDLNWLFELRGIGDYGITDHVPHEEASRAIEAARRFLEATQAILPAPKDQ